MYQKSKLKNGIRIITIPLKSTKTITVLVMIGTGSKNENKKNRGISHFLEHMFFKGTRKRPTTLDISKELDKVGGSYNAFTGKEYTGLWAKVGSKHCDLALDVISDMLLNSRFSDQEIEKEKGTIIEEINMYLDNPIMRTPSLFENLLYSNQPLGYDELGSKKTVTSVKRDDFINYYRKYYKGNNIVMAITGNFNKKEINKKLSKYFGSIKKGQEKKQTTTYDQQQKPEVLLEYKKTDQTHLCLGVRGYNANHKDKYVLSVLSTILGGNMSSRLFISVREKEGLAYYIHTLSEQYQDVGYFTTQAGVSNGKCKKAIKIILNEYRKIKEEKISNEEIRRAKDYLQGKTMISLESSDALASFAAVQEISTGKILTAKEKFAKINAVTANDLQRVANDIFIDSKLNLALIGPFRNKEMFKQILKF
jgi:predicted Zn-dependent peptidase